MLSLYLGCYYFSVLKELKRILIETFGYESFRFTQQEIISSVINGEDVLAVMPTGAGKSICYQIPALYLDGVTIVVSPLISLMNDQVAGLSELGINSTFLNSELSYEERIQRENDIASEKFKIVYVSPEGLLTERMLNFFSELDVSLIAIDEAHCVSQWGHEFRKDYMRLGELRQDFPGVPILALTATADERTREDIKKQLKFQKDQKTFISSFDRPNIYYQISQRVQEIKQLDEFIKNNHKGDTGIVYCLSRKKVERVTKELQKLGYNAHMYHAGCSKNQKAISQKAFNKEEIVIIVATIAFGMGINRPDVRFVAHLDLPKSVENYYQETGRAGRDGERASAWMVYGLQDVIKLSQMIEMSDADYQYKQQAKDKLNAMLSICETAECRRAEILKYFAEKKEDCNFCDTCDDEFETFDATIDAQKVLSTIYRTGQVFGAGHVIDVLRGSKNNKVLDRGHDKLSVYAIGKDKPKEYWSYIIRQLLTSSYISVKNWEYRSLRLEEKSNDILKKKIEFVLRKVTLSKKTKKKKISKDFTHRNMDLFEKLRMLRKDLASEMSLPPYMVFSDKSLHDMCLILPRSQSEFLLVHGVGKSKSEKYGDEFLKVIRSHV